VTIGAHRQQICDRINDVLASDLRQRANVMNVDIPFRFSTIHGSKIELADAAASAVSFDALSPSFWIALVGVDNDAARCTLNERDRRPEFVWRGEVSCFWLKRLTIAFEVLGCPFFK